ncbi:MAG TPA: hypothetical protein DD435_16500 [Cyanobacteria bacterium UBA8530]|nr:hypothetical protein [Cyanobacteria bacterium UBA8530]
MEPADRLDLLLGQILQRNRFISFEQLEEALAHQAAGDKRPIGEILSKSGACTPDQLLIAVMQQYALLSSAEITNN